MLKCRSDKPGSRSGFDEYATSCGDSLSIRSVEIMVSGPAYIVFSKADFCWGWRRDLPHIFSIYADEVAVNWMS
jgi:hypothetical protein